MDADIIKSKIKQKRKKYITETKKYTENIWVSSNRSVRKAENEYIDICKNNKNEAMEMDIACHLSFLITNRKSIGITPEDISGINTIWMSIKRRQAYYGTDEIRKKFIEDGETDDQILGTCYKYGNEDVRDKLIKKIGINNPTLIYNVLKYGTNLKHISVAKMFQK